MGLKRWHPAPRFVSWPKPKRAEVVKWPVVWVDEREVVVRFEYPYEGYDICCNEHGHNPETYDFQDERSSFPLHARH